MASLLYRLGRFTFRRRWLVAACWLTALVVTLASAVTLSGPTSEATRIPGTRRWVTSARIVATRLRMVATTAVRADPR
jgi:uncharacterized membrane protein YdfJ with MMPL/SSD domain